MEIQIVSHALCPHAQRFRLLLLTKGLHPGDGFVDRTIDLGGPPDWFRELSPSGRMPVLTVSGNGTGEAQTRSSGRLLELLDELLPGRRMPTDPWERYEARRWLDDADALLDQLRGVFTASSSDALEHAIVSFFSALGDLEVRAPERKVRLEMADIAMAPVFTLGQHPVLCQRREWAALPQLRAWSLRLAHDPHVRESACDDSARHFARFFEIVGSTLARSVA